MKRGGLPLIFTVLAVSSAAMSSRLWAATASQHAEGHDYSGVECLREGLNRLGKSVNMLPLLDRKYVGYGDADSLILLQKAASDMGSQGAVFKGLNVYNLASFHGPVILHVKRTSVSDGYDYFVLYVGQQDGCAIIDCPPAPQRLVPFYMLASCWRGDGIALGQLNNGTPTNPGFSASRILNYLFVGLALIALIAAWAVQHRWRNAVPQLEARFGKRALIQGTCIVTMAVSMATAKNVLLKDGLLYRYSTRPAKLDGKSLIDFSPQVSAGQPAIPEIDHAKTKELIAAGVLLIDARPANEFSAHIEGAINVPDNQPKVRGLAMSGIPKDRKMVVYCSNSECPRARTLAEGLRQDGFIDVIVYAGGFEDWVKKGQ